MHMVFLIIVVYVEMQLTSSDKKHIGGFKADMHASFEMSDSGHLHYYLGIQLTQVGI